MFCNASITLCLESNALHFLYFKVNFLAFYITSNTLKRKIHCNVLPLNLAIPQARITENQNMKQKPRCKFKSGFY